MTETINLFPKDNQKMRGIVQKIIFSAKETKYAVFTLKLDNSQSLIKVTTKKLIPLLGQEVKIEGRWEKHPRFGDQFEAQTIEITAPTDEKGIERFLASGAIKGIGEKLAHRIVSVFGKNSLQIIETSPKKLSTVKGISFKKAQSIQAAYTEQSELKEIMLWLEKHGTSGIYAARIFQTYGSMSIRVLEDEPYRLTREVKGIGFLTVDSWMQTIGIDKEDENRILAGISYILYQATNKGHVFLPEKILAKETAKILQIEPIVVHDTLQKALKETLFVQEFLGDATLIYEPYLYKIEKTAGNILLQLQKTAENFYINNPLQNIEQFEQKNHIKLAASQKIAILTALKEGVLILTGGPGTGKTTIIKSILDILKGEGKEVLLAAPTGRAAQRLQETTGEEAMTIHRLLEAQGNTKGEMSFLRNEDYPLEADVIIIDEASMLDIYLTYHLLNALQEGTHLILVGDADQLPSVGAGRVLYDIISSKKINTIRLTQIFRQAENSKITVNAHLINQGRMPELTKDIDKEFIFLELENANLVAEKIVRLATEILFKNTHPKQEIDYQILANLEILSPMHKGIAGVENLNILLQEALNPPREDKDEITLMTHTFRLGDKVMQTKNNYIKQVFNGDIGFIIHIDETILVNFGNDKIISYDKNEFVELQLAYAMTVHKSQGSEYDIIIMPILKEHYIMLQRNLLYTAITRGKKKVILLGHKEALRHAVENNRPIKRYTLLTERLREILE